MEQNNKQKKAEGTIFDDVFRTMAEKMPALLIPLINEVFHKNYPEDERIELMKNEHMTATGKIITDSHFRVRDSRYHIECQSRPDGIIAIRMFEYDIAIALSQARQTKSNFYVKFPESCVLYLRHNSKTREKETVTVEFAGGITCTYSVPIIKVQDYTKEQIFEKKLLLFLPYYIMRYEKQLKGLEADKEEFQEFLKKMENLKFHMEEVSRRNGEQIYADLSKLIISISDYVLRDAQKAREEVRNIMGGEVMELYSEKLLREGREEGREEGMIRAYISLGVTKEMALEKIMEELKVSEEAAKQMIEKYWK